MSFILEALTQDRAKAAPLEPQRLGRHLEVANRRRHLWRVTTAVLLGLLLMTLGYAYYRSVRPGEAVAPEPHSHDIRKPPLAVGAAEIPSMPPLAGRPMPQPAQAPSRPYVGPGVGSTTSSLQSEPKFDRPAALSQALPNPGRTSTGASEVPPAPKLPSISANGQQAELGTKHSTLGVLDDFPGDMRALVESVKVRVAMHTPQRSQRFLIVDDRRLHEGDELVAGVHLEEITELGMVLRYQDTRVLAPLPLDR